jgi:hypothetical protein
MVNLARPELRQPELRRMLAAYLVGAQVESRLPTVRDLGDRFGASVGAVQGALTWLAQAGAVTIESRRGTGMVLKARSVGELWAAAQGEPLVIALPLPSNMRAQGLATGIKAAFAAEDVEAFLIFLRGSRHRLRALRSGRCHAVVMSALGAREACGPNETVWLELPPETYAEAHRVYYLDRGAGRDRRLRVVIDRDSADLQRLSELEFEDQDVEWVPATYMQFIQLMQDGRADAAVWDIDETIGRLPADFLSRPLSPRVLDRLDYSNTRATVVTRREDDVTRAVIADCLRGFEVVGIQREVMAGRRVPEY